jgi:ParB family chromosome partitioning protein
MATVIRSLRGSGRWRAAQLAQLHEVPVVIREFSDAEAFEVALIENVQRQDLNAIEEAEGYKRLIDEYGHTQEVLGRLVNKSRSHVSNLLRLLDLPDGVRRYVAVGELSMGHARALIPAENPQAYADEVVKRGLSVRDTEKLVRLGIDRKLGPSRPGPIKAANEDIDALERQLGDLLGLKVTITHAANGGRSRSAILRSISST